MATVANHENPLHSEEELRERLEEAPDDAVALVELAAHLRAQGRPHAAAAHIQRASALLPAPRARRLALLLDAVRADAQAPLVSVVLVVDEESEWIRRAVLALAGQDVPGVPMEVIVLDTGSGTPVQGQLANVPFPEGLRVLVQRGATRGEALNLAAFAARGELLLFLDEDAIPSPHCVLHHAQKHLASFRHMAVMGAFPPTRAADRLEDAGDVLQIHGGDPWSTMIPGGIHDWTYFWTCNLSLPRAALAEVGGFDERIQDPTLLDLDLGYRLMGLGYGTQYEPDLACAYDHGTNSLRYLRTTLSRDDDHHHLLQKHGRAFARDRDLPVVDSPEAIQRLEGALRLWETRPEHAQRYNRQAILVNLEGALRSVHWPSRRIKLPHLVQRTCRAVGTILDEAGEPRAYERARRISEVVGA